ncbi:MAG: hypothetical protein ACI4MI_04890 [Christensenellales bacterium]
MLDWLQFSPDRLTNPVIIVAICLAVAGMVGVLYFSARIKSSKVDNKVIALGIISAVLMLAGVITAIVAA